MNAHYTLEKQTQVLRCRFNSWLHNLRYLVGVSLNLTLSVGCVTNPCNMLFMERRGGQRWRLWRVSTMPPTPQKTLSVTSLSHMLSLFLSGGLWRWRKLNWLFPCKYEACVWFNYYGDDLGRTMWFKQSERSIREESGKRERGWEREEGTLDK